MDRPVANAVSAVEYNDDFCLQPRQRESNIVGNYQGLQLEGDCSTLGIRA